MDTIGIFALILAVVALVKIVTIVIKPKAWFNLVEKVWKAPNLMMLVCLVLAAFVFYNLIQELTIVQIFAVILFVALLGGMSIASYSTELIALGSKMLKDRSIIRKAWISILVWLFLVLWALKELVI